MNSSPYIGGVPPRIARNQREILVRDRRRLKEERRAEKRAARKQALNGIAIDALPPEYTGLAHTLAR